MCVEREVCNQGTTHGQPLPRPQETLASTEEVGKDLEHVQTQKKKSEDFEKDMAVNAAQLDKICVMANELIGEGHSDAEEIHDVVEVTGVLL